MSVILCGRSRISDWVLLIDCFHELADDQGNTLYPLDFFLGSYELSLQAPAIHSEDDFENPMPPAYLCSSLMYSSCRLMYLRKAQYTYDHHENGELLEMSLKLLQGRVLIAIIITDPFNVDARNIG